MKSLFLSDVKPGGRAKGLFAVAEARSGESRNGPYWSLVLQDATGRLPGKIWSPLSRAVQQPPPGLIALVEAKVESYRDQTQLVVERFEPVCVLDDSGACRPVESASADLSAIVARIDPADFMASSSKPPAETLAELRGLLESTLHFGPWRRFALGVLDDPDIRPRLLAAPAAKNVHHAHAGGLLEHTLSICTLCLEFARRYPQLDVQTLLVAAAFHDIGKAWEISSGLSRDYTDAGMLLGHIHIGLTLLKPRLEAAGVPDELADHFQHIVLSHHGQYEYGSPKLPMTAEAFALHFADNLDAKMSTVAGLLPEDAPEGKWTERVPSLERKLFKPMRTPPGRDPDLPGEPAEASAPVPRPVAELAVAAAPVAAASVSAAPAEPAPAEPASAEPASPEPAYAPPPSVEAEPVFEFEPDPEPQALAEVGAPHDGLPEVGQDDSLPPQDLAPVWDYEAVDFTDEPGERAKSPEPAEPTSGFGLVAAFAPDADRAAVSEPDPEPVAVRPESADETLMRTSIFQVSLEPTHSVEARAEPVSEPDPEPVAPAPAVDGGEQKTGPAGAAAKKNIFQQCSLFSKE